MVEQVMLKTKDTTPTVHMFGSKYIHMFGCMYSQVIIDKTYANIVS